MKLPKVSCKYGSPMGRSDDHIDGKCKLSHVSLNSGGYDNGGAYWGYGIALWVCTDAENNMLFVRAQTRSSAKYAVLAHPLSHDVTFFR